MQDQLIPSITINNVDTSAFAEVKPFNFSTSNVIPANAGLINPPNII